MKVAVVYNRDSRRVINLFGIPNQEKIGLKTIRRIADGLRKGGHQVREIEGDKDLVENLERFMPRVVKGELPGMVFNISYGIQGQARYTHVPSILEMLGIPYVGSGPLAHSLALDKVVAKMIFQQHNIPTPWFTVMESPKSDLSDLRYPLIVKPKNEAVSFGLRIVNDEKELRDGASFIFKEYGQSVLVEQYIEGREINVGLIGNNPPGTLPPVELHFGEGGPAIYTLEDKKRTSGREIDWECPASLDENTAELAQEVARRSFSALGCYDCARVDMRLDSSGQLHVLELNSLPSLGEHGSFTIAAEVAGLDFDQLVCRLVEVASSRYFGTPTPPEIGSRRQSVTQRVFSYLVERRDEIEKRVHEWTALSSRTADPTGMREVGRRAAGFCEHVGLKQVTDLTDEGSVMTWETRQGMSGGILLVLHLDVPVELSAPAQAFRRDPEWLYGEGIGTTCAPLVSMQFALRALRNIRRLRNVPLGLLCYSDEGRECRYSSKIIRLASSRVSKVLVLRPGNIENRMVNQRRGWRKYRLGVSGKSRRLGKVYRKRDVLRWTISCIDDISRLTSRENRVAVACSEIRSEAFPRLLPHRVNAVILMSYLDAGAADATELLMRELLKRNDCTHSLDLISDRPPLGKNTKSARLYKSLKEVADEWDIPLEQESSLYPSAAGLVPANVAVVCGAGPVARNVDTPQEAVLRISLPQRTLLLAQYLANQAVSSRK